MIEYNGTLK